jgi:transposase
LSKFATVQHFCSWLGLCPQVKKTGGRLKSSRTRPGVNRAAVAFRLAANSLHASKGALGAFLRRKKAHLGAPKAVTATAHKLARIVYLAIRYGMPYVRQSQEEYQRRVQEQQVKAFHKKARALGFEVIEKGSLETETLS